MIVHVHHSTSCAKFIVLRKLNINCDQSFVVHIPRPFLRIFVIYSFILIFFKFLFYALQRPEMSRSSAWKKSLHCQIVFCSIPRWPYWCTQQKNIIKNLLSRYINISILKTLTLRPPIPNKTNKYNIVLFIQILAVNQPKNLLYQTTVLIV